MSLKFRQFALLAIPLRTAIAQGAIGALLLCALGLMVFSQGQSEQLEKLRMQMADIFRPSLMALQQPAQTMDAWFGNLQTVAVLQLENKALREEVVKLREWHAEAVRLDAENRSLRSLLQMKQPHEIRSAAGQVLADNGASFGHSVLVSVPEAFVLRRGLVAMTGDGMVGRTVDVAPGTGLARVLLLDDPASRIPVFLQNSKVRAVLAGQGNGVLMLEHMPSGSELQVNDQIMTAGDDGVLPTGLPLARIVRIQGDRIWAQPLAPLSRLDWLRLVDFGTIQTLSKPNFLVQ